ncbi:DNA-3-methyladenine glycosylase [Aeromicrobium sp. CF4.19]|uniref:DNA-3-methyladenine glycosylase n=1 Tax=Aeromicrobium sp. CF4.19 TaxID=3373082 RepID=UPI003EE67917
MNGVDFDASPDEVAPQLLGAVLTVHSVEGPVAVRISEVEAYNGGTDPASHAWKGPTSRTRAMFGPSAHLYVYLSHGLHWCCNFVTGPTGTASGVLIRAGEVVQGVPLATSRRRPAVAFQKLASGPGNLTSALGISDADYGRPLVGSERLSLAFDSMASDRVASGPRVGVSRAADVPWRFWIEGDPTVTTYRRSARAGI